MEQPKSRRPTVKDGVVSDTLTAISLVLNFNSVLANLNTEYYYFYTGKALGGFLAGSLMAADDYLDLGIITPENPWDRYA